MLQSVSPTQSDAKFREALAFGKIAESQLTRWLRDRCGYRVLPVYDIDQHTGKGPRLLGRCGDLVVPDMLIMRGDTVRWVEAKRKSVFSWWRMGRCWVTGIDLHHYKQYLQVEAQTPWPVWLLFLHEQSATQEGSGICPVGLFGEDLVKLQDCESHRSERWGSSGMVYWRKESLQQIATLAEIQQFAAKK